MMQNKKINSVTAVGVAITLIVGLVGYLYINDLWFFAPKANETGVDETYIDFIDCGQGDSSLIVSQDCVTLIDTTTAKSAQKVVDHLEERGVDQIDHLVLTHPHEDHIGGTAMVLDAVDIERVYMKSPTKGTTPTSKVYRTLIDRLEKEKIEISWVEVGDTFDCGEVEFSVLGPIEDYKDQNNQSIILMAEYNEVSVLFTGDQETDAEEDLVEEYGASLDADILKVGHHGSRGSTSDAFLDVVTPEYGVISCGDGNTYGHPHEELIDRLNEYEVACYRTDLDGTVTLYTDGVSIKFEK